MQDLTEYFDRAKNARSKKDRVRLKQICNEYYNQVRIITEDLKERAFAIPAAENDMDDPVRKYYFMRLMREAEQATPDERLTMAKDAVFINYGDAKKAVGYVSYRLNDVNALDELMKRDCEMRESIGAYIDFQNMYGDSASRKRKQEIYNTFIRPIPQEDTDNGQ